jgi:5'-nucleotidase
MKAILPVGYASAVLARVARNLSAAVLLLLVLTTAGAAFAQAKPPVQVRLIGFNDFHGHLESGDNAIALPDPDDPSRMLSLRTGGVAFLATQVRALRREVSASVVISGGDLVGASPLVSALFHDEPTIEAMNLLGLDVNALGNHEFDRGTASLQRLLDGGCAGPSADGRQSCRDPTQPYTGARFASIAANVLTVAGQPRFAPFVVRDIGGIRVGIVGAVTRSTPGIVLQSGIRELRFVREAAAINGQIPALRAAGAQVIVAVIHEGGDADGGFNACLNPRGEIFSIVAELDPAVDVVFSAHTHRGYACLIDGRPVIQGASFGRLVSVVDLLVDPASGRVIRDRTRLRNLPVVNDQNTEPRLLALYQPVPPAPDLAAFVVRTRALAAPLAEREVGTLGGAFARRAADGGDSPLGRLIADAHLAATRAPEHGGAQIAFTNPGGIRGDLGRGEGAQRVNYGDLFSVQPFGNALVVMTLTGTQIRALLESQWSRSNPDRVRFLQPSRGFSYAWRAQAAHGERIDPSSLRLDGVPLAAADRYRVTVNSFLAEGGDGFSVLRAGSDRSGGSLDLDALTAFIRAHSPLAPDPAPRITRLP